MNTGRVPLDDQPEPEPLWWTVTLWWRSLSSAARAGIGIGVGFPLWILWLIGGIAVADGLWRLWLPLGIAWLAVVVGVAVGVPVWLVCRDMDKPL